MRTALEIALCLIFSGCAITFGGVQPITCSLAEICLFLSVLVLLWSQSRKGAIRLSVPVWPLLFALLVLFQMVPLPRPWIAGFNLFRNANLAAVSPSRLGGSWETISIYTNATAVALFKFLACLAAFVLATHLFESGRRKSRIVWALVTLGSFEAAYGILQYLLNWNQVLTFTNFYDRWVATGTYVNRNHFAGLLELTFPFAFALAFYSYQIRADARLGRLARPVNGTEGSAGQRLVFYLFLGLLMLLGIVFSRSRSGILCCAITLLILFGLSTIKLRRKAWALGIVGFTAAVLACGMWIGLNPVLMRFENTQGNLVQDSRRIPIWKDTIEVIRSHPAIGTGLGTFEQSFRPHQTGLVNLKVDHAHNDYLEFASETGVFGAALLFIPIFCLLIRMMIAFLDDHRRFRRAVLLGCIGSTLALLGHSLADFNLHVPANAIIFAVILGIGYKAACIEPADEAKKRAAPTRQTAHIAAS